VRVRAICDGLMRTHTVGDAVLEQYRRRGRRRSSSLKLWLPVANSGRGIIFASIIIRMVTTLVMVVRFAGATNKCRSLSFIRSSALRPSSSIL
jgi:hypothetical protein